MILAKNLLLISQSSKIANFDRIKNEKNVNNSNNNCTEWSKYMQHGTL